MTAGMRVIIITDNCDHDLSFKCVSSVYFVHIENTIVCLPVCNVPLPTITIKTLLPKNLHIRFYLLPFPLLLLHIMKEKYFVHPQHIKVMMNFAIFHKHRMKT